ncbi:hypothetical protein FPE01S_05_01000 [Flavihumibacter petaseus NBRC 106054]|uniref:Uncharacterized protein n=2 Tax=Flavihumibacter TaxID=1004301 RepID=A0A0E9N7S6_9BACT|nr:hypothetical protein FPE01S_05_01000 [Flavihumibacter petaseus NBRC 106054]
MVVAGGNELSSIDIVAFPNSGRIEQQTMNGAGIVNVDMGSELMFSGIASNPGGVKTFSVEVSQNGSSLYSAKTENIPNASNKVNNPTRILGTNGSGGAGSQPMTVTNLSAPVEVSTTAAGFGTNTNSFKVTYVPVDPNQRGKDQQIKVTLHRQITSNLYTAEFPETPFSGKITGISNPGSAELIFLKKGQSPANCNAINNPAALVILAVGSQVFPADIDALFGPSHTLPVTFMACTNPAAGSSPLTVDVLVTFHVN